MSPTPARRPVHIRQLSGQQLVTIAPVRGAEISSHQHRLYARRNIRRKAQWNTPLGTYDYRHIQGALLTGYRQVDVAERQTAYLATPSKALFDLLYLTCGSSDPAFLRELRLENLGLDPHDLQRYAELAQRPSLEQAVPWIARYALESDQNR